MRHIRLLALLVAGALPIAVPGIALSEEKRQTSRLVQPDEPGKPPVRTVSAAGDGASVGSASTASNASPVTSAPPVPVYQPPLRGAPGGRVGGGTRGVNAGTNGAKSPPLVLSVLAPDHTGLTVSDQPSLYWFISSKAPAPVEMTLVDPRATTPVLEIRLAAPVEAGVHRIRLADHGVRLEPGVAYRWYVAVVPDPARRARDHLAGGAIERIDAADRLRASLAEADSMETPALYAQAGLWYDAITALSERIDRAPGDAWLRRQRAAMLEQVGLPGIGD